MCPCGGSERCAADETLQGPSVVLWDWITAGVVTSGTFITTLRFPSRVHLGSAKSTGAMTEIAPTTCFFLCRFKDSKCLLSRAQKEKNAFPCPMNRTLRPPSTYRLVSYKII